MVSVEKIEGDHWEEYSFEELKDTYGGSRKVFDTKQVIVGGDIAIYRDYVQHKTRNAGSDLILHHTNQNGDILYTKLIIISAIDEKEGYQRIFDQIISTFRFLE